MNPHKKKSQDVRSGDLGGQNWSAMSSFPTRPYHRWGRDSFRKRRTSRCQLTLLHGCALGERSSGGIWKFRTFSFKCYVDHSHTKYSSGNIDIRNWVHLFESCCTICQWPSCPTPTPSTPRVLTCRESHLLMICLFGSNIYTSTALSKARSSVLIGIVRNRTAKREA